VIRYKIVYIAVYFINNYRPHKARVFIGWGFSFSEQN